MKTGPASLALALALLGCGPHVKDAEDYLRRFPTAENRNRISLIDRGLRYDVHFLESDFLAARDMDWTSVRAGGPVEIRSAFSRAKVRYQDALYFLVRMTREGTVEPQDGIADPELFMLQRHLQSRQESLRMYIRLRAAGREDLRPSQVIVSSLPGPRMSITLLIAFPTPEDRRSDWEYLSLAGIEGLPLHTDFRITELRPELRLVL